MTPAERRALAAALRHGRTRYAFRCWGAGFLTGNMYCWYHKPFDGRDEPVLRATDMGGGQWVLTWPGGSHTVDSVGFALSVLAFFGVYQPATEDDEGCCPPDGECAWHREQLDLYSAAEVTP